MPQPESDTNDPWTFFGQFSKGEIEGATRLLTDAKIEFEAKEGNLESGNEWSGPFALWVRDESVAHAAEMLTQYFASNQKRGGEA